jgi:polysaccharide deacetylase family protein (PEP-CTERM system associated)
MELATGPTASAASAFSTAKPHQSSPKAGTTPSLASATGHICTVTLEDYFSAAPLRPWIRAETWYRFESRLADSTQRTLELLDTCEANATFFVESEAVRECPALLRQIQSQGHELAVRGGSEAGLRDPRRAKEEVIRLREELEQAIGRRVFGFRARTWLTAGDRWMLDVLAESGYAYDSSLRPAILSDPSSAWRRPNGNGAAQNGGFREVALSSIAFCGVHLPIGGGSALRLIPSPLLLRAVARLGSRSEPYVMHLRPWELDPEQPRIQGASTTARLRQYRNLERMPLLLRSLLTSHRFTSVASHFGLQPQPVMAPSNNGSAAQAQGLHGTARWSRPRRSGVPSAPTPVTVVVPCYNETQTLPYLRNTLKSLKSAFEGEYAFTFLFVDDCSTDGTWMMLKKLFADREDSIFVRHEANLGIAGAIQTGLHHARTSIVCSIDCDCTYDPHELGGMIPLLVEGVDVVTASPYHPSGGVRNVPGWRLTLSKTLSRFYRLVLRQKLFTYTSCFRVYRRDSAIGCEVRHPGFLGIAEMIARMDLSGRRVVEYPAVLDARVLGQSKMKLLETSFGHLGLLIDVAWARLSRPRTAGSASA